MSKSFVFRAGEIETFSTSEMWTVFHFSEEYQKSSQNSSPKGSQKGSQKSSQKVLELIRENPQITTTELSERIGITRRSVAKIMNKLQTENVIRRVGSRKIGFWEIIHE